MSRRAIKIDARRVAANLGFATAQLTHAWDRYPAKMAPHLARYAIEGLSSEGDRIADPFCGCGTVAVEALLARRNAVGLDINPVAVMLAHAKSVRCDTARLRASATEIARTAEAITDTNDQQYPRWLGYWFTPRTLEKLRALRSAVEEARVQALYREVLLACLAVCVRNCSRADPRSPKPFISKQARATRVGRHFNPFSEFMAAANHLANALDEWLPQIGSSVCSDVYLADAAEMSAIMRKKVDAVVTSPPYLSAQDYCRSTKLELAIVEPGQDHCALGARIIGSGRGAVPPIRWSERSDIPRAVRQLKKRDARAAAMVVAYLDQMDAVVREIKHVLRPGGQCCLVIGDCRMRDIELRVHRWILEIAKRNGFVLERHEVDAIRDRRVPPKRNGHTSLIASEHLLFFSM